MKINYRLMAGLFAIATTVTAIGCKPKTTAQKIEDKMEDAGHEAGQAVERAGETVNDAVK